jgi:hypothetical protein
MSEKYVCPVCGYLMDDEPVDYAICPSCGVEFDADTLEWEIQRLQEMWIARGMEWTIKEFPKPLNYDPILQLKRLAPLSVNLVSGEPATRPQGIQFAYASAVKAGRLEHCHA